MTSGGKRGGRIRLMMPTGGEPERLENCYWRALQSADCELLGFDFSHLRQGVGLPRRLLRATLPSMGFPEHNKALLNAVKQNKPDVLWIFKGMEYYPSTLAQIKASGVKMINYNADHPISYVSRGSGSRNVKNSIDEFDLHITYSRTIQAELAAAYPEISCLVVPFGHEVSDLLYEQIVGEPEIERICFIGNPDSHRRDLITKIKAEGLPIDVYGHNWARFLEPGGDLEIMPPIVGEDMYRMMRRYRVQLNFLRAHNAGSHNMRSFEAPACGAVMLAEDTPEHRDFFEADREAVFFDSDEALIYRCSQLLGMSEADADEFRERARRRSANSAYHYADRARQVFSAIERLV